MEDNTSQEDVQDVISAASDALTKVPPNDDDHTVAAACLSREGRLFAGTDPSQVYGSFYALLMIAIHQE